MAKKLKHKQPTMYDVARLAGVSQPTVSRILNHHDTNIPVSDETREKVLAAVQQLGYRPNTIARSLRTQRTQTIALLLADISNGFYHPIARAIQDVAREYEYEVFISNSDHLYKNEKLFCEAVLRRSVDGVIMVPIHLTYEDLNQFVSQVQVPMAILGEHINHQAIDMVYVNDEKATYEGTQWLLQRGYTRIGFIGVPDNLPPGPRRFRGYLRAITEAGLNPDPRFIQHDGDFTLEGGARAAQKLIQVGELPSAVVVLNDLMAIGLILGLQEAGYHIPDDIAVLGFDDIAEATIVRPALTTIAQDARDIGLKLAHMLFERIENPDSRPQQVYESTYRLIQRDSA
jgi:DNA-binding LacI/PurR family transcriptional regulator